MGKDVYDKFANALRQVLKVTRYGDPEGSTSVFTIKYKSQSRIEHSVDLAVMFYDENGDAYALCYYKKNGGHGFQKRFYEDIQFEESWVKGNVPWQFVRDQYLESKNKNPDVNKHSRHIYYETIHNLFDQYYKEEEEEDDEEHSPDIHRTCVGLPSWWD